MPRRVHGFHRPFHPLQMLSWVYFTGVICGFYLIVLPTQPHPSLAAHSAGFALTAIAVSYFAIRVGRTDTADECSLPHLSYETATVAEALSRKEAVVANRNWCPYCTTYVQTRSKHCRLCDKCVHSFDHHCKWLNNCVGGENYSSFLALIGCVAGFLLYALVLSCYAWHELASSPSSVESRVHAWYGQVRYRTLSGLLIMFAAYQIPPLLGVLHLIGLHAWLAFYGITTYEWIVEGRNKNQAAAPKNSDHGSVSWCGTSRQQQPPQTRVVLVQPALEMPDKTSRESGILIPVQHSERTAKVPPLPSQADTNSKPAPAPNSEVV